MNTSKIYELSRDYARAWELIQQGAKLACWVDALYANCRHIVDAYKGVACLFFMEFEDWEEYPSSDPFEFFVQRCTERNAEFYLPIADKYIDLLVETQPQIITNDEQNDANLAHIERLWNTENRTPDEDQILDLLLLLSEEFKFRGI
jgi:hypothetical protein